MFCIHCGAQLPDNAKFCTGCGQPLAGPATPPAAQPQPYAPPPVAYAPPAAPAYAPPAAPAYAPPPVAVATPPPAPPIAPAPAAEFAGLKANITVTLQGADKSLKANGSYDEVNLGKVTPQRFLEILLQLLPQQSPEGDDVCPIGVHATGAKGMTSYMIDSGHITGASGDREYTPEDAVRQVLGQAVQVKIKLPKGWKPLRHPELPPTDRDEADPTLVDLNSQPQVSAMVWAGDIAKYVYAAGWGLLGMSGLFMFVCLTQFTVGVFLAALLCIGVSVAIIRAARKSGYQRMRMGVDWATNAIWVNVDGKTQLTSNASCIQDFTVAARTITTTRGTGLKKQTTRSTVYNLTALMSNGKTESVFNTPEMNKRKSEEVQRVARDLLARLG